MGKRHDLTDIYGVKHLKSSPLGRKSEAAETGFRHSGYYHRYFQGYTEIRRIKPNGRIDVERYYTQPWIVSPVSSRVYWLTRAVYLCLTVIAAMLYVWALFQNVPSNRHWLAAIPSALTVVLLILLLASLIGYLFAPRRMTLWDYESSTKRLKFASLLTGGSMALTGLAKLLFTAWNAAEAGIGAELLSAAAVFAAGAAAALLFLMEKNAAYTTLPNDTVLPEGEVHEIW